MIDLTLQFYTDKVLSFVQEILRAAQPSRNPLLRISEAAGGVSCFQRL
jgi:hypothetical protein